MKLLCYDDLKLAKSIQYSKVQIWRLEKQGMFPKRIEIGPGRRAWAEHEIDVWIASRIADRDSAAILDPMDRPTI
ncbi:MAG: AlpA family phage regulatory protein [Pseudolabrys sp.]|jgi:prophage regulatory protein